ncbi:hypothetical protein C8J57DRAFT_1560557 [Mycena rebaudengoi]|nr:hypothetical protein C8J57DRAFT_1560557 [Mycena rebaudengoi]
MVAVNALLAISLASLSLTPSADAAAIRGRAPDAGSPTKPTRQRAPVLPMPMMKAADKGKHREGTESISKRGKQHQARRPQQAPFAVGGSQKRAEPKHKSSNHGGPSRRQENNESDQQPGVPGSIDIHSSNPDTTIAHLVRNDSSTPAVLDASQNSKSTFYLVPSPSDDDGSSYCTLQIPAMDVNNNTVQQCATYDPAPSKPGPLTMTDCSAPGDEHASQRFSYDPDTHVIRPMWFKGEDDGQTNTTSTPPAASAAAASAAAVSAEDVNDPDDYDESAPPSDDGSSFVSRDGSSNSQSVTLVFVPSKKTDGVDAKEVSQESSASASPASSPAMETTTVTVTVMASASPSDSLAAADVMTDSPSSSQPTSASSSDIASSMSSDAPAPSESNVGALDVEMVAPASPSTDSGAPTSTDSNVPSSSTLDAAAVASDSSVPSESVSVTPTSTDSSAPSFSAVTATVDAAAVPASSDSASAALSSTDSSAPASTSIDAAAVASDIAAGASDSSSIPSESASGAPSSSATDLSAAEVDVSRAGAARAEMTLVSTEPYQWMFKAEPRW